MMLKTTTTMALLLLATTALADEYTIDPAHANARFAIDHFGTSTNHGGFYNLTGTVKYDAAAQTGFVDITIPVSSLNSGNSRFDTHLESADLFNAAEYPVMRFVSKQWHFADGKVSRVDGFLTLLGQTRPLSLTATKFNCYQSPILQKPVCGGDFETTLDRTQWGMNYLVNMGMSKNVKLNIQIEAAKQP